MKKVVIIALGLILLGAGAFFYYVTLEEELPVGKEEAENNLFESEMESELGAEIEPEEEVEQSDDFSIEGIKAQLQKEEFVRGIAVSPNQNYVAYLQGQGESMEQLFLWEVGCEEPEPVEEVATDCFAYLSWSPNSEYLIADYGTWTVRSGLIVQVEEKKLMADISYHDDFVWSPDSQYLALSVPGNFYPIICADPKASDLVLYNLQTGESKIIAYGCGEYGLVPKSWDEELHYVRHYYQDDSEEKFSYNGKSPYNLLDLNNLPELSGRNADEQVVLDLVATLYHQIASRDLISAIEVDVFEPFSISNDRQEAQDYLLAARVSSEGTWDKDRSILAVLKSKRVQEIDFALNYEVCFWKHTPDLIESYDNLYELIDLDSDGIPEIIFKTFEATQGGWLHVQMYIYQYRDGKYEEIFTEGIKERTAILPYCYDHTYEFRPNPDNPQLLDLVFSINTQNDAEYLAEFSPEDYEIAPGITDEVVFVFQDGHYLPDKEYEY